MEFKKWQSPDMFRATMLMSFLFVAHAAVAQGASPKARFVGKSAAQSVGKSVGQSAAKVKGPVRVGDTVRVTGERGVYEVIGVGGRVITLLSRRGNVQYMNRNAPEKLRVTARASEIKPKFYQVSGEVSKSAAAIVQPSLKPGTALISKFGAVDARDGVGFVIRVPVKNGPPEYQIFFPKSQVTVSMSGQGIYDNFYFANSSANGIRPGDILVEPDGKTVIGAVRGVSATGQLVIAKNAGANQVERFVIENPNVLRPAKVRSEHARAAAEQGKRMLDEANGMTGNYGAADRILRAGSAAEVFNPKSGDERGLDPESLGAVR